MGGYEAEAALAAPLAAFYDEFRAVAAGGTGTRSPMSKVRRGPGTWRVLWPAVAPGDEVIVHVSNYGSNTLSLLQMTRGGGS